MKKLIPVITAFIVLCSSAAFAGEHNKDCKKCAGDKDAACICKDGKTCPKDGKDCDKQDKDCEKSCESKSK